MNLPASASLRSLFDGYVELRAVIDAVLEGRAGSTVADSASARLSLGCYEVFGGDARRPGARRLLETVTGPRELVFGNDPAWRRLISDVHGERVSDRPMRDFDPSSLDRESLAAAAALVPASIEIRRLDADLAAQLDGELEPHALQVFDGAADFVARGVGFGAVAGGRLACAATSYAVSSRFMEIAVATRPAFRGRGLAAATTAALLCRCLDAGLLPRWSASNPVSQRLAVRLGFVPAGICEVLYFRA